MASPRLVTGAIDASTLRGGFDHEGLRLQRVALRASRQRHALGGLPTLGPPGRRAAGVAQADERPTAEVRDQEGDLGGAQRDGELLGEHVGRRDR